MDLKPNEIRTVSDNDGDCINFDFGNGDGIVMSFSPDRSKVLVGAVRTDEDGRYTIGEMSLDQLRRLIVEIERLAGNHLKALTP